MKPFQNIASHWDNPAFANRRTTLLVGLLNATGMILKREAKQYCYMIFHILVTSCKRVSISELLASSKPFHYDLDTFLGHSAFTTSGAAPALKKWGGQEVELIARKLPNAFYIIFTRGGSSPKLKGGGNLQSGRQKYSEK